MKLEGAQVIAADRMTVWNAINDPEILKRCISGCEEMTRTSPTQYEAIVRQKIGPVSAKFEGAVELSDVVEGRSLRLSGVGKGGVAGMAKGGALVTLTDVEGGTQLAYEADASVAGKLAQLGSRLIDGVAQKLASGFFSKFKDEVEGGSGGITMQGAPHGTEPVSVHDTGAGGVAMAAAAGAVGVVGEAVATRTTDAAQGAWNDVADAAGSVRDTGEAAVADVTNVAQGAWNDATEVAGSVKDAGEAAVADASGAAQGAWNDATEVAGSVKDAGEAAVSDASGAARGAWNDMDARTGALHDSQAERMLNPAIGAGAGDIDMDDPDIGDIDVSSVDGGPSEAEASLVADTHAAASARAAGSQGAGDATVDVSGNLSTMSGSFDPEGGSMRDHVGAAGTAAAASVSEGASDAMAAADRVGEQVSASAADAQAQAEAMRAQAANASRSAMEGAREGAADMQAQAASSGAAPISTMPGGTVPEAPEAPEAVITDSGDPRISGAGMAAGAAAVGGIGAAVSGFAARAQGTFDDTHDKVRDRVIAAGGDVDESKSWGDTKEHLGRAASETRDTAQDVYDAARARIEGDKDRASAEWNEAKTNAGDTVRELKGAGEDAWTTGKGYAAEEAKAPKVGPLGQPWYLWIIGVIVLLVILWIL